MKNKELKKQEITEVPETKEQQEKVKHYDFGHLVVYCGKCNSKYIIKEDVPGTEAVQIVLPPTNTAELRLVCKDCRNEMSLFYVESSKKKEEIKEIEATEDEVRKVITNSEEPIQTEGDKNEPVSEESTDQKQSV